MKHECNYCDNQPLVKEEVGLLCRKCGTIYDSNAPQWEDGEELAGSSGRSILSQCDIKNQITKVSGLRDSVVYSQSNKHIKGVNKDINLLEKKTLEYEIFHYHRLICDIVKVPEYMREASEELLKMAYHSEAFIYTHEPMKKILAGVCLYIKIRENKIPITMKNVSEITGCKIHSFGNILTEVKKALNIDLKILSVEEYIAMFCQNYQLDSEVQQYMVDLIPLLRDVYSVGSNIDGFLLSAAYISFMTIKMKSDRKFNFSYNDFCKLCGKTSLDRGAKKQYNKMCKVLTLLCENLPWVDQLEKGSKGRPNLCFYIDDLLKHQNSVIREACTVLSSDNLTIAEPQTSGIKRKEELKDQIDAAVSVPRKKQRYEVDEESGPILHDIDSETLCEEDLTELEVAEYLRTENEICAIKNKF